LALTIGSIAAIQAERIRKFFLAASVTWSPKRFGYPSLSPNLRVS
jgi:hypothetical protein